jgi:hypothetical protein
MRPPEYAGSRRQPHGLYQPLFLLLRPVQASRMTVLGRTTATQRNAPAGRMLVLAGAFIACGALVTWSMAAWLTSGQAPGVFLQQIGASPGFTSFDAWASWDTEGSGPDTAILATIDIPEQRQRVHMAIRPNYDPQLPASHIVEITVPPVYPARSVEAVSSLFVKGRREDAGRQLIGAVVNVAPDTFWMALSAARQDREANLALLSTAGVFQLNISFKDGARGVLAFEKGNGGRRVFEQALAAWQLAPR